MKKYLIPTILATLFIGFVRYATVETRRNEQLSLLDEKSGASEENILPNNNNQDILSIEPTKENIPIITVRALNNPIIIPTPSIPIIPPVIETGLITEESPLVIKEPVYQENNKYSQNDNEEEDDN